MTTKDLMQASYTMSKTGVTSKEAGVSFSKYAKEEPIIKITTPEVTTITDGVISKDIFNFDNSHVIFKGVDLGTFLELVEMKKKNQDLKEEIERQDNLNKQLVKECQTFEETINKAIEYIRSNDIEVLKYHDIPSETTSYEIVTVDLLKILKGE